MPIKKAAAAGAPAVVIDDVFHYTTKAGAELAIDLDIPPVVLEAAGEDATEEKQFAAVAEWMGEDIDAAYKAMGLLERARFLTTFFTRFQEAAGLALGESLSSSDSSRSTTQP